jgi:hypothetical protein
MTSILQALRDPAWWFSVIVVALLVNVIAAFAKDWLGQIFSRYAAKLAEEKRQLEEKIVADAMALQSDWDGKIYLHFAQINALIHAVVIAFVGTAGAMSAVLAFAFGAWGLGIVGGVCGCSLLLGAALIFRHYNRLGNILVTTQRMRHMQLGKEPITVLTPPSMPAPPSPDQGPK